MQLSMQEVSSDVTQEKYAKGDELSHDDIFARVGTGLASAEKDDQELRGNQFIGAMKKGFFPAGRIMSAAGTDIQATLINCFVQPIADSIIGHDDDGKPGIYIALQESAETMRRGGGVGYAFDPIRPMSAMVKGTGSHASGPLSYMKVFDRSCETIESAGARRGAQMSVMISNHPDILTFVHAKDEGELRNFNISVGITDAFMEAVENDAMWPLVHEAEPTDELKAKGAYYNETDEVWVYDEIPANALYRDIMQCTYDHGEPGVIFLDRINKENNLWYCESISACNPCAEQPLPNYGSCCLGSHDLTRYVVEPFTENAEFDFKAFEAAIPVSVRMLDNVLDVTYWPLEQQKEEAHSKRRIGVGFTGLGDTLVMMGIPYNSEKARTYASRITEVLCDSAYRASVELAKERGAFPLFDKEKYLQSEFVQRLPSDIQADIAQYGIRNSHLISIAPTGTMSLAFADNTSNGIEPAFSWYYDRKKRMSDGSMATYQVEDHAYRLYKAMGGDVDNLPDSFVSALEISVKDHAAMQAVVQPYVDSAISKTVNIPEDYDFGEFCDLYRYAWRAGLKGLATFRPNSVLGSVLSVSSTDAKPVLEDLDDTDPDRRIRVDNVPELALSSLRWQKRPQSHEGNPSWTNMVKHPYAGEFAVFIGHVENGENHPFEIWINGAEAPRGIGGLAKSLSMDMRSEDRGWLQTKLSSLMKVVDAPFQMCLPDGTTRQLNGTVAALAQLVLHRCEALGVFDNIQKTPLLDALISPKEPKTGPDGTMSWTVDIYNPATGDDFVMGLKELTLPDGSRRPYSVWMSGNYPRSLDGLCKSLSFDMRVYDPAWIGKKLRQLLDYAEPLGDFMARVPGEKRQQTYPSTIAYLSTLILHRYVMLGILDEEASPVEDMGGMDYPHEAVNDGAIEPAESKRSVGAMEVHSGKLCSACGVYGQIKKDGCDFCTSCGTTGSCG